MQKRIDREKFERGNLAPYAQFADSAERVFPEERDEYRTDFQRDCQRIYHSQAFRRMQGKRQVLPIWTSDHIRTRLTHTLEVAQISRSLARIHNLNEDLAEAIALGHDLGHTPFGHLGEEGLNRFIQKYDGHFEHNEQSVRVVTVLEQKSEKYKGLNLTRAVLDGLNKHRNGENEQANLEGQIVNLADEIAYSAHDLEDSLQNKIIKPEQIKPLKIWEKVENNLEENWTEVGLAGRVINYFTRDLNVELEKRIAKISPKSGEEIKNMSEMLAGFSEEGKEILVELRSFLWENYYGTEGLKEEQEIYEKIMGMCDYLMENPEDLPGEDKSAEGVKDYVAGMTDLFFEGEYKRLIKK